MPTREVIGLIVKADGTVWADFEVKFTVQPSTYGEDELYPEHTVSATTAVDGTFSATLNTGITYLVEYPDIYIVRGNNTSYPVGSRYTVVVAEGVGSVSLEDLRAAGNPPTPLPSMITLIDTALVPVNAAIALKADTTVVDALSDVVDTKADTTDLDAAEATIATHTTEIASKADAAATTSALAGKASTASVTAIESNAWVTRPRLSADLAAAVSQDSGNRYSALRSYWTALAKRESSPVDILCIGDSITEGDSVTTLEKRWVARLRDKLRTQFPVASVVGGQGYIATEFKSPPDSGQPFTLTGGASGTLVFGLFGLATKYREMTASGHQVSITVTCSSFDVLYTRGTAQGTMGVAIDGGAVTNVSNAGATQSGTKWSSGALTPGSHSIVVSWVSGGKIDIEGIMVYNGDETKGIRMWEAGFGGARTDKFIASTYWPVAIAAVQPDLVTIELGINNYIFNTGEAGPTYGTYPPATAKANLLTLISNIRANCSSNPSIVLIAVHDIGLADVRLNTWDEFLAVYDEIAAADTGVSVLKIRPRIGLTPWTSSGLLDADTIHLNDFGSEFYANAIAGYLAP